MHQQVRAEIILYILSSNGTSLLQNMTSFLSFLWSAYLSVCNISPLLNVNLWCLNENILLCTFWWVTLPMLTRMTLWVGGMIPIPLTCERRCCRTLIFVAIAFSKACFFSSQGVPICMMFLFLFSCTCVCICAFWFGRIPIFVRMLFRMFSLKVFKWTHEEPTRFSVFSKKRTNILFFFPIR